MLHKQRTAAGPASGPIGQEVDAALILVDGGPKGMADPAFPAQMAGTGHWAMAVCVTRQNSIPMPVLKAMDWNGTERNGMEWGRTCFFSCVILCVFFSHVESRVYFFAHVDLTPCNVM